MRTEGALTGAGDGKLFTWGKGVLGCGASMGSSDVPQLVKALADKNTLQVSLGLSHALCVSLTKAGLYTVFAWGQRAQGMLGLGEVRWCGVS